MSGARFNPNVTPEEYREAGLRASPRQRRLRAESPEMTAIKRAVARMESKSIQLNQYEHIMAQAARADGIEIAIEILKDCLEQQGIEL